MEDFNNISNREMFRPDKRTLFGTSEDFDSLPAPHKEQIRFLDHHAFVYLRTLFRVAQMGGTGSFKDFSKDDYKEIEEFNDKDNGEKQLKQWLYERGIPFSKNVFILADQAIYTTWKIIVEYAFEAFWNKDVYVFDQSLTWCLFHFHHDKYFFGNKRISEKAENNKKQTLYLDLKNQYPDISFPY